MLQSSPAQSPRCCKGNLSQLLCISQFCNSPTYLCCFCCPCRNPHKNHTIIHKDKLISTLQKSPLRACQIILWHEAVVDIIDELGKELEGVKRRYLEYADKNVFAAVRGLEGLGKLVGGIFGEGVRICGADVARQIADIERKDRNKVRPLEELKAYKNSSTGNSILYSKRSNKYGNLLYQFLHQPHFKPVVSTEPIMSEIKSIMIIDCTAPQSQLEKKWVPIIKECTTRLNLSSLVITGCLIKDGVIDNMVNCENIVRLDLSRNQLTGKGISKLAKKLQNVRDLNLEKNLIDDQAMRPLGDLQFLKKLNLNNNMIGSEGLTIFAQTSINLTTLEQLSLSWNLITEQGAINLISSLDHPITLSMVRYRMISHLKSTSIMSNI